MADSTYTNPDEEREKARIKEAMSEPVMADLPEELRRTKRNFLALASVMIFYQCSGASIKKLAAFGLEVSVENPQWLILWVFLIVGAYLGVQFIWLSINYFMEIRVRITGEKQPKVTSFKGNTLEEPTLFPVNPRQASLHFWWSNLKKSGLSPSRASESITKLNKLLDNVEHNQSQLTPTQQKDLRTSIDNLRNTLDPIRKTLSCQQIQKSLTNYKNWVTLFSASQLGRYFVLDLVVPLFVGGIAFYLTINAIYTFEPHGGFPFSPASLPDLFR